MTPSYADPAGRDVRRSAALVAAACVLQVAESLIPHPVPGVRLGLANIVTLITLAELGFRAAMEVALLRTVVASLVLGSFLTPGFLLSFASAAASTVVMWALLRLSLRFPAWGFSLAGVSVAGAAAHNASQLYLAYLLLIRHESIFYFAPWLAVSGVITGWLTALVAAEVLRGTGGAFAASVPALPAPGRRTGGAPGPVRPEFKIAAACGLLLAAVFAREPRAFALLALCLLALMAATRLPARDYVRVFNKLRGLTWLALASLFFPLFFTPAYGGGVLFAAGPVTISAAGLAAGAVLASRVLLMGWIGFLLNVYASPAEIAAGLAGLGRPFARFGFRPERTGAVIGLAWGEIPAFSARARAAAASALADGGWRGGPVRWSVGLAAGVVAGMCGAGVKPARTEAAA